MYGLTTRLLLWFYQHRREFSWRCKDRSFYQVLVVEMMSQQTQIHRISSSYDKWMLRFPNLQELSIASDEDVLLHWLGLGYYHRALRIRDSAKYIMKFHKDQLPSTTEELLQLPGVGEYTAEAIQLFAQKKIAYPIDINVKRVFTRLFAIDPDKRKRDFTQMLSQKYQEMYDIYPNRTSDIAESIIELGALHCTSKPKCDNCPLKNVCKWYQSTSMSHVDQPKKKSKIIQHYYVVLFLTKDSFGLATIPQSIVLSPAGMKQCYYYNKNEYDLSDILMLWGEKNILSHTIGATIKTRRSGHLFHCTLVTIMLRIKIIDHQIEWIRKIDLDKTPLLSLDKGFVDQYCS